MHNKYLPRYEAIALFAALILYWILPGHLEPIAFNYSAIGLYTVFALAMVWLLCFALPWKINHLNVAPHLLGFTAAFIVIAGEFLTSNNNGLAARYYDNINFSKPFELSIPMESSEYTRTEPAIDFSNLGFSFHKSYFLLSFANETHRRQWQPNTDTTTKNYPFSIELKGYLKIPANISSMTLVAEGGDADMLLEEKSIPANKIVATAPGVYAITVRYSHKHPTAPGLRLLWNRSGNDVVVPATAFTKSLHHKATTDTVLKLVGFGVWIVAFAVALFQVRPTLQCNGRSCAWLLFFLLMAYLSVDLQSDSQNFDYQIFQVGDDWFRYESLARAIARGDWLSEEEGKLIFLNFGYRYVLALMHWLAGEAPANAMLLQRALMAATIVFSVYATQQLFGARSAIIFLIVIIFTCKSFLRFAQPLLDTVFGISLSFGALYYLIRYRRTAEYKWVISASLLLGCSFLIRTNFLPFLIVASIWLYLYSPTGEKQRRIALALFLGIALSIFSLLGLRNYLISGQWIFMPTNGLPNLWVGNHPPAFDGPTYFTAQQVPHHEIIPRVLDYWLSDPTALAQRTWKKALYILGVDEAGHFHSKIGLPWLISIAGTIGIYRQQTLRADLLLLLLWIGIVNLPLLILFPWGYGWRLSAPSYLPLYIVCSLCIAHWSKNLRAFHLAQIKTGAQYPKKKLKSPAI